MKRLFGDKVKLLYTDTDSAVYKITGIYLYGIINENIKRFDTSDYSENNQFGIPRVNKKVIGLMKDECNGNIMTEFIDLRSKMYCVRIQNEEPIKKVKGIKSSVVKNCITFDDFRECLFDQSILRCQQNNIRSRLHVVRTERQEKVALSYNDDKRFLLPDTTDTLPWGHYSILDDEEEELFEMLMDLAKEQSAGEWEEWEGEGRPITCTGDGERADTEVGIALLKERNENAEHIQSSIVEEDGEPPNKKTRV